MQCSAVLLVKGVDVGSFSEEEVHHLKKQREGKYVAQFVFVCVCDGLIYNSIVNTCRHMAQLLQTLRLTVLGNLSLFILE